MNSIARPSSRCRSFSSAQDLRLHHHVERGGGLVGDHERRVARERHRDHHALLLAAGELVRVVVDPPRRQARPARAARPPGPWPRFSPAWPWTMIASAIWSPIRAAPGSGRAWRPGTRSTRRPIGRRAGVPATSPGRPRRPARSAPRPSSRPAAAAGSRRRSSTCRSRTRRPARAPRPRSTSTVTPRTAGTGPPFVWYVMRRSSISQQAHRPLSFGLRMSSRAYPIIVNESTTSTIATPGGTSHHQ